MSFSPVQSLERQAVAAEVTAASSRAVEPRRFKCRMHRWFGAAVVVSLLLSITSTAAAVERTLTAVFRPSVLDPGHVRFVDTTPRHNYCENQNPACKPSIRLGFNTYYNDGLENGAEGRQALYLKMPSQFRSVSVTNRETGETAEVLWRVDTFTQSVASRRGGDVFEDRGFAPAPCSTNHVRHNAGSYWFDFQWAVPEGATCIKRPVQDVDQVNITNFGISYEMLTPDPLGMGNGLYEGRLDLSVGQGGDFDFGDRATPEATMVSFIFQLTVEHQLTITVPPGSNRAILSPEGGWSQWADQGRKPPKLSKEVPFTISSSSPFDVKLVCQHPQADGRCGLVDQASGDAVSMTTLLSIPGLRDMATGEPAVRYPLSWHDASVRMRSDSFLVQRPSRVHFEVDGADLDAILDKPGSHWKGDVTVVFDAQL